jgi:formate dehydrogenase gamma subunit
MRAFWDVVVSLSFAAGLLLGWAEAAPAQDDLRCLACHSSAALFQGKEDPQQYVVTQEEFAGSVHGALGLSCVMCHQDLRGTSFPHPTDLASPDCGACHASIRDRYNESVHGYAWVRGNPRAPTCATCHGRHNILRHTNPESPTYHSNLPQICEGCHGTGLLTEQHVRLPLSAVGYAQSVHGRALERGVSTAAACTDCHGVHDLKGPADPASRINHANISQTCGRCHDEIRREYEQSIHGLALETGVRDSPTCIDCHGEHLILSREDPDARTCASNLATQTCGPCHDDPEIIAKYNLQGGVVGTYEDSYHGWASRRGCEATATCVSCHTAHLVLPAADSASTISDANIVATCGQCHENADARFAHSYTHETTSISANPVNRTIRYIYIWAIALIIGGMVIHNVMIMNYFMVEQRREEKKERLVLRFDRPQLVQHLLTTVSFIVLVITGFALRFPEAWWVDGLAKMGMTETVRGDVHRIFAVLLIITAFYHMYYVFLTRRGRREFKSIFPSFQDITDAYHAVRYYTFTGKETPKFGRYDYTQKAEYWALVWGTIVMIVTGLILWFPTESARLLPTWTIPAAQTVHYYEAWLATLAILVWHFFFVIFHPEEYPMSWSWITGKMSEEAVKRHHGRWYDELKARGPDALRED